MMTNFIDCMDKEGFRLVVDYGDGTYHVTVTSPKGESQTESFIATFVPRFGMDVFDVAKANAIAEKLSVRMGATPFKDPNMH